MMASAVGGASAARRPGRHVKPVRSIGRILRRVILFPFLFLNPIQRCVNHRVVSGQERITRELYFYIGSDAQTLQRLAAHGDVVRHGVLESIAVWKPFELRWQRGRGGMSAEDTRPSQILQAAREDFRGGGGERVDQYRHRT